MESILKVLAIVVIAAIFLGFFFAPSIIAYRRQHAYRYVILGINLFTGLSGIGWLIAIVWALWPAEKSLTDPVLGNVTGLGYRNTGDTQGAVAYGVERGYDEERAAHEERQRTRAR